MIRIVNKIMSLKNYKNALLFGAATLFVVACGEKNIEKENSTSSTITSNEEQKIQTNTEEDKELVINKETSVQPSETTQSETSFSITPQLLFPSNANYSEPCYCSSGDLFFVGDNGSKLSYLKKGSKTPINLLENGRFANNVAWSKNCKEVYFKEKNKDYSTTIKSIDVDTKKITTYPNLPELTQLKSLSYSDTAYFLDKKTLDVKARYNDKEWIVIKNNETGFYMTSVSPNGKYIATHQGSKILLYGINGKFIREIGNGIASDWSPNSKYLIGFEEEESHQHHEIGSADIYLYDISNGSKQQLTQTTDALESWPSFKSADEIVYTDMNRPGVYSKKIMIND